MKFLKILLIIAIPALIQSCISLKSEFPPVEYYKLNQEAVSAKNLGKIDITLMIRAFTAASDLDTEHLLASWEGDRIQPYYYHRWASDCSEMVTDFFFTRFSKTQTFTGGVVSAESWVVPDYFIEAKLLEMMAYSSNDAKGSNSVNVSLQLSLARRNPLKIEKEIVYSENYSQKILRTDNSVSSIVPAFSKALSQIADKVLLDIQSAVAVDRMKTKEKN